MTVQRQHQYGRSRGDAICDQCSDDRDHEDSVVSRESLDQTPRRPSHGRGSEHHSEKYRCDDEGISHGVQPITNPLGHPQTCIPVLLLVRRRAGVPIGPYEVKP